MTIDVRREGVQARMRVTGKLDEAGAEKLKQSFFELNRSDLSEIVLDFNGVTYIGSACIGKLLLFYKEMFEAGGKVRIINTSPTVYNLLRVVKLDQIMNISKA